MKITVAGSGAWGTALAIRLVKNGHDVTLWSHNPKKAAEMEASRINPALKGVCLPDGLKISGNAEIVAACEMVVIASPSFAIRSVCKAVAPWLREDVTMVSVTKGIEPVTLMRMSKKLHRP